MTTTNSLRNFDFQRIKCVTEVMNTTDQFPQLAEAGKATTKYFPIPTRDAVSVQIVWVDGTHTNGSWQLQVSNDGSNWINEGSAIATTASATAATNAIKATSLAYEYARIVYTKGSNTAGTFSLYILARSIGA